ncbi:hypothetical protein [Salipiger mangrovisoli]|uniref:YD repeat-containing protein n=1 Tax=Salipiger mangrovisoli TaxID=2865933 RepID=A0ABR9X1W7_9RHOB|nr:hypothetical protein [Salipiger mangrovisoli]MBE9637557.1 hypothetical protein [Salipiger mangrovisoli]
MRLFATALLAAFAAAPLHADIAMETARFAPGSLLVMQDDQGHVVSHLARGEVQGLFRFDLYDGATGDALYAGRYYTDARGEVLLSVTAQGSVTRFEPYSCTRTLGECEYEIIHADGRRELRLRETLQTETGLAWKEWTREGLIATGGTNLDEIGAPRESWRRDLRSGDRSRLHRISLALQ